MDKPKGILALRAKLSLLAELADEFPDGLSGTNLRLLREAFEQEFADLSSLSRATQERKSFDRNRSR
jgi:hypothetical protein